MKIFNVQKIIKRIRNYPWLESIKALRVLPHVLKLLEKLVVAVLILFILAAAGFFAYQGWLNSTKIIPEVGGALHEGIVGESKDLDKHVARLVNAGLTKYDNQKNIVGDIAQSWDINDGGKTYVFHLRSGFDSKDLAAQITAKNLWSDIAISEPDAKTLTFTFKQPFSPFLNVSTKPIFNYGPYQLTKENKNEIEFQARDDYYAGRPFIDQIVIDFFSSEQELEKALKRGQIQGYFSNANELTLKNSTRYEVKLPRDLNIFFNLSNKDLADLNVRRALKDNTSPGKNLNLRLVTSDNEKNLEFANKIQSRWAQLGVKVTLDIKDNITLQKTSIPKRDYDVLLYGLDYGEDPDPYPFWHSSQIGENGRNLSNFNNKQADKLLEDARQELDLKKREEDYVKFQAILDDQVPMFLVEHQSFYYQLSKEIKGVNGIYGFSETDRFLNVSQWYINTKRIKK